MRTRCTLVREKYALVAVYRIFFPIVKQERMWNNLFVTKQGICSCQSPSMEEETRMQNKISLFGAVSTGIGMIIATSCFIPLASGASTVGITFIIALILVCMVNMMAAGSIAELNALMPNLTGGLAQYTLVGLGPFVTIVVMVGGYIISNVFAAPAEGAMFANVMANFIGGDIPTSVYSVALTMVLIFVNLRGMTMSALVQTAIASFMVISLFLLGLIGALGLGTGIEVEQAPVLSFSPGDIFPLMTTAFWLFIGSEFIVPLGKDMKNPKRNVPRAMLLSLAIMGIIQCVMVLGFSHYTPWAAVGADDSPHLLYATALLGEPGRWWMIFAALFAAVSTQNSIICSVAEICCGMAKIRLLPAIFQKKNKYGAPYLIIWLLGIATILIETTDISSGEAITFLILCSSLFWMVTYIICHVNVIILRRKMAQAPRSFKMPLFPLFQAIGIVATMYMIYYISTDPDERMLIFKLTFALFLGIGIWALYWVRYHLHLPIFRHIPLPQVMAMENPAYYLTRHPEEIHPKN